MIKAFLGFFGVVVMLEEDGNLEFEVVFPVFGCAVWMEFFVVGFHFFLINVPGASECGKVGIAKKFTQLMAALCGLVKSVFTVFDVRGIDDKKIKAYYKE